MLDKEMLKVACDHFNKISSALEDLVKLQTKKNEILAESTDLQREELTHAYTHNASVLEMLAPKEVCIKVWPWAVAPEEYKALSTHGGDEDWVAYVPVEFNELAIPWLGENGAGHFGVCNTSVHDIEEDDATVYIGAHS